MYSEELSPCKGCSVPSVLSLGSAARLYNARHPYESQAATVIIGPERLASMEKRWVPLDTKAFGIQWRALHVTPMSILGPHWEPSLNATVKAASTCS